MIIAHVTAATEVEDLDNVVIAVDVVVRIYLDEVDDGDVRELTGQIGAGAIGIHVETDTGSSVLTIAEGADADKQTDD